MTLKIDQSVELFQQAQTLLPGGVDSPVRAFRAVGGQPIFIERGSGPYLYDVDGNRYIDYVLSWGPLILGHAHPDVLESVNPTEDVIIFGSSKKVRVEKFKDTLIQYKLGLGGKIQPLMFLPADEEEIQKVFLPDHHHFRNRTFSSSDGFDSRWKRHTWWCPVKDVCLRLLAPPLGPCPLRSHVCFLQSR